MKVTGEDVRAVLGLVVILASWCALVFTIGFVAGFNWWLIKAGWDVFVSILP